MSLGVAILTETTPLAVFNTIGCKALSADLSAMMVVVGVLAWADCKAISTAKDKKVIEPTTPRVTDLLPPLALPQPTRRAYSQTAIQVCLDLLKTVLYTWFIKISF